MGFVGHQESLTCMCGMSDNGFSSVNLLVSGNATGQIVIQRPNDTKDYISMTPLRKMSPDLKEKRLKLSNKF